MFKIYKYQPRIEKRHALLKSTLEVAPIWLKKNTRIEALMFLEFLGQMVAALIERELRQKMVEYNIDLLCSLPEGRPSKTPTIDQVLRNQVWSVLVYMAGGGIFPIRSKRGRGPFVWRGPRRRGCLEESESLKKPDRRSQ